ncbi:unnamed protein product [Kuraishia capsulata CBS 1993]|uniref:Delta 8-(E)-sphingolipid desaturase n=1 Tax=Kuraishia capsulata CBS 1993 TaxID=1382522 RepID=W6MRF0_9ASCO|nr:uncharacterized protein KUCA_T00004929001 [Kuraishia capsulata CBS 1993]CDK28943.1 unnamed protein product [Kuraishia capsulata CBS 1993]
MSKILSREEIEHLISVGRIVVIYDSQVLDLKSWIDRHPGGDKAVHHMIGKDATDEMNAYHSPETIATFRRWRIGSIDYLWENMIPPIQGGVFRSLENKEKDTKKASSAPKELSGKMPDHVKPRIPAGTIPSKKNEAELFPVIDSAIRDPKAVIENYDNRMVRLDLESVPPLDYATQTRISQHYRELHKKVVEGGYYQCRYIEYFKEFCRCGSLLLYFLVFLKTNHLWLSAFCLGCAWQQLPFIVHDAGHIAITHNYHVDNIIGALISDFIGGLSIGWWKRNHNVHHLITNDPVHDPDIQHLPFFAVSSRLLGSVYSTYYENTLWFDAFAKTFVRFQRYTYYLILSFGRFNLYRLSWIHLILGQGPKKGKAAYLRYLELTGLCFFFYWFFYLVITKRLTNWSDRLIFLMISHVTTMVVHVQITLSHFGMSTSDLGPSESFAARQLRTTMDVDCPEWFDYFHGGLQFQAIHHLFPRLPRHNFRRVQPLVIDFCNATGLKYSIYGFMDGNGVVLDKMGDVGKQVKIIKDCLKGMKMEAEENVNLYEKRLESIDELKT